jgi:hypothetical protein
MSVRGLRSVVFVPPKEPPKLRKPNRQTRRATAAVLRKKR